MASSYGPRAAGRELRTIDSCSLAARGSQLEAEVLNLDAVRAIRAVQFQIGFRLPI